MKEIPPLCATAGQLDFLQFHNDASHLAFMTSVEVHQQLLSQKFLSRVSESINYVPGKEDQNELLNPSGISEAETLSYVLTYESYARDL